MRSLTTANLPATVVTGSRFARMSIAGAKLQSFARGFVTTALFWPSRGAARTAGSAVRRAYAPIVALVAAVAAGGLAGCSLNPATGAPTFAAFMSPAQEVAIGRAEHPRLVAQLGGGYDDAALSEYVGAVGETLASVSDRPALRYTFTVIDSDRVNAHSLPGGYVYITRGALALATSEDELAAILAHEIAHIAARHSATDYSLSILNRIGDSVAALLPGAQSTRKDAARETSRAAYSRAQEREADAIAVRYLAKAGYDPTALARFLDKLAAESALRQELGQVPGFVEASAETAHPGYAERARNARRAAQGFGAGAMRALVDASYLRRIDGLVFGDSPRHGFVRGRVFAHPDLGFRFEVPAGFVLTNRPNEVVARRPDGAMIVFDAAPRRWSGTPAAYLRDSWAAATGFDEIASQPINGFPAAVAAARLAGADGGADVLATFVALRYEPGLVLRFLYLAPDTGADAVARATALRDTVFSFRRLSEEERAMLRPFRLALAVVGDGEGARDLAARMSLPEKREAWLEVLNGLPEGVAPPPGSLVKIVVN